MQLPFSEAGSAHWNNFRRPSPSLEASVSQTNTTTGWGLRIMG